MVDHFSCPDNIVISKIVYSITTLRVHYRKLLVIHIAASVSHTPSKYKLTSRFKNATIIIKKMNIPNLWMGVKMI